LNAIQTIQTHCKAKQSKANQTNQFAKQSNMADVVTGLSGLAYALYKTAGDETFKVVRVLNVPDEETNVNPDTPLHLCDPSKLITQHRLGNHELPHRTIDPAMYESSEIEWYGTGILPPPMYMCFILERKCYLCGDIQDSSDDIHGEFTENFREGYRFCIACAPYFRMALYKPLAPIWRIRLESERADRRRTPLWVHRTRRDEFGKSDRTNSGRPFRYTRWFVSSWIPLKSVNKHDPSVEPFEEDLVYVEEWMERNVESGATNNVESGATNNVESGAEPMSKCVSVMDLFFANRGSLTEPNYDPNTDDPLNQIRHLTLDEKRAIMQRESAPFE
jgi:hypothetical protein